jgi:hypothetical protein
MDGDGSIDEVVICDQPSPSDNALFWHLETSSPDLWKHYVAPGLPAAKQYLFTRNDQPLTPEIRATLQKDVEAAR